MNGLYVELLVACVIAVVSLFSLFNNIIKARLIEDTPTSRIRSASQGYTELSGFCRPHEVEALYAPLTGRPCLWYHYRVERYERSGKNSHWRTLESKSSKQTFILSDGTGDCVIDPRKADVTSSRTKIWRGHSRRPVKTESSMGGKYRYTEKIVVEEDYLYALGMFQSEHAPSADEQQKQKTKDILNQWKQNYNDLLERFDRDANGELDLEEWELARQEAAREAHAYVLQNYSDEPVHFMTYSKERRRPYLLSNHDPKGLSSKYRWRAAGAGVFFIVSTAGALFLAKDVLPALFVS